MLVAGRRILPPDWRGMSRRARRRRGHDGEAEFDLAAPGVAQRLRYLEGVQADLCGGDPFPDVEPIGAVNAEATGQLMEAVDQWPPMIDGLSEVKARRVAGVLLREGLDALGQGSNRVAVKLGDGFVGKLAWGPVGLTLNLHDASVWLAFDDARACRMIPSVALTSRGVLVQRAGTPISPPILPLEREARYRAKKAYEDYVRDTGDRSGGTRGLPPEYAPNRWEDEIHKLRRLFGEGPALRQLSDLREPAGGDRGEAVASAQQGARNGGTAQSRGARGRRRVARPRPVAASTCRSTRGRWACPSLGAF
jgi:hypothetical protein